MRKRKRNKLLEKKSSTLIGGRLFSTINTKEVSHSRKSQEYDTSFPIHSKFY